jgi:hypothetical protein
MSSNNGRSPRKFGTQQEVECKLFASGKAKIVGYEWGGDRIVDKKEMWQYIVIDPENVHTPPHHIWESELCGT